MNNITYLASINYEYSNVNKSAKSTNFITPFGQTKNFYTISDLSFGKPVNKISQVLTLELKAAIGSGKASAYKFAFAFDYSTDGQGKYAIQVPLYFINGDESKTTGLEGGVRIGYTNNTSNSQAIKTMEIFITTPFHMLNEFTTQK